MKNQICNHVFFINCMAIALVGSSLQAEVKTQTIQIDFIKVYVADDCDNWPNGAGDFFYEFKVDNDIVVSRPWNNPVFVDSGGSFSINSTQTITKNQSPGSSFTVYGEVREDDDFLSGAIDNAGHFTHTYTYEKGWSPGPKSVRLTGDGCDVTVYYKISLL